MNGFNGCAKHPLSAKAFFIVLLVVLSVSVATSNASAQEESQVAPRRFDPAVNTFLVNDRCFYLPALLESEERLNAEEQTARLFDIYGGMSLGIARTTALLYQSGSDANGWLFYYDTETPEYYYAYERAYAIGFYGAADYEGNLKNGIPGDTLWTKFVVDPRGSLFRTIVDLNDISELVWRATVQIDNSPDLCAINCEEARMAVECIEDGYPWPVGLCTDDPELMYTVLAYALAGENHPRVFDNSTVLVVWDPGNIRDYYAPDEEGYSPDDYDYIEISTSGELRVSFVHTAPDFFKYLVFDAGYDPENPVLTDNINRSLSHQAEAMGRS